MGQDIETLNQSITNISTSIIPMLSFPVNPSQQQPQTPQVQQGQQVHVSAQKQVTKTVDDDDVSVGSNELKKIMETIDDEEGDDGTRFDIDADEVVPTQVVPVDEVAQEVAQSVSSASVDIGSLSAEDLKKVSYNDIRKYCKQHNIDDKGSKEVLIYRIKNPPRP
jgi:hypothetical protein